METALTKVHDDILRSIDNKCSMILLLLDLSVVFDTVDRNTLLERLSQRLNSALLLIDFLKNQLLLLSTNGQQWKWRYKSKCYYYN